MNSVSKCGGGIHNQVDGQMQFLESRDHQDVLSRLNNSCESSRAI